LIEMRVVPSNSVYERLLAVFDMAGKKQFPETAQATKVATSLVHMTWKMYAMGADIPGSGRKVEKPTGEYARSIHKTMEGPFRGVVYTDSPYATTLEDGSPRLDLKKIIPFGQKARMGKNGPYTIVPIRHGTPTSLQNPMPQKAYNEIRRALREGQRTQGQSGIQKSSVVGQRQEPNAFGQLVSRSTYQWGGSLRNSPFPRLEGLTVFDVSAGKQTRSVYLTFRVVSANPPKRSKAERGWANSWVVPAKEGLHLARYAAENTAEEVQNIIRAGIERDLTPMEIDNV
jgi:hypothetical protein